MELKESLVKELNDALVEICSSVISVVPIVSEKEFQHGAVDSKVLVASIGMAGKLEGSLVLIFNNIVACKVVSKMLSMELADLCQDVMDGIGEVANILAGGLKTRMSPIGYAFDISIPTVIQGTEPLNVVRLGKTDVIALHVEFEEYSFDTILSYSIGSGGRGSQSQQGKKAEDASSALEAMLGGGDTKQA